MTGTWRWTGRHHELTGHTVHKSEGHEVTEHRSPTSVSYRCSCGWRHTELRRQNAFARAAKLRAALREHLQ